MAAPLPIALPTVPNDPIIQQPALPVYPLTRDTASIMFYSRMLILAYFNYIIYDGSPSNPLSHL